MASPSYPDSGGILNFTVKRGREKEGLPGKDELNASARREGFVGLKMASI
jgi:hypothetical protein